MIMLEIDNILRFINIEETIKRIHHTEWLMTGAMPGNSESVTEYSYGTALAALISSYILLEEKMSVDISKVLTMALLHDLLESRISNIPIGHRYQEEMNCLEQRKLLNPKLLMKYFWP